ncbi:TetR/AcrR family transcriptional regulator [Acidiferrimicrobium sp. IK]|uniref:TetR/AcrR family transcriptional regulator n=1 Tax=Acidiferrimicrobium sp. IK TaxID=2871700 RepID=UPI0021CB1BB7|nr:TetR/AcrR family transcriptional regulator [Acidiferrimicrobium sp. IK]MCU4186727.1 TetR/AcrR family transcriptional regulator [Acidiferrimicrobium sp. IK]
MPEPRSTVPTAVTTATGDHQVHRRPGGRSERVRAAVADAVLELFRERQFSFGVTEVADRAGVHRATVYRRWPTRGDLIAEALSSFFRGISIPDTGSWPRDVHALASALARFFNDPVEIGVITSLITDADPLAAEVIRRHWDPIVECMKDVVERAKTRGEIAAHIESGRIIEMLIGPFVVHTVVVRRSISRRHVTEIAELVVRAALHPPEPS